MAQRLYADTVRIPTSEEGIAAVAAALLAERRATVDRVAAIAAEYFSNEIDMLGEIEKLEMADAIRQRAADAETADHVDPLAGRAPRHGL
jgi:hypothetical protein